MENKNFDSYFDELCKKEKNKKEQKKDIFEKNIQSHIVYVDENGNVSKTKNNSFKSSSNKLHTFIYILGCVLGILYLINEILNHFSIYLF